MGGEGIEPSLSCENQILSLARLPVPPLARVSIIAYFCAIIEDMESENGGQTPSERQRQTAAEIARKKVLAVYSSTVENLRNLPASSRERLIKGRERYSNRFRENNPATEQASSVAPAAPTAQPEIYTSTATNYPVTESSPYEPPSASTETTPNPDTEPTPSALKDTPVNQATINEEWQKYHSAWQDYYQNYYSNYYAKAAQAYLETEKLKTERIADGSVARKHNFKRAIPFIIIAVIILTGLFLQYNRRIFAPIMAYISPDTGSVSTSLEAVAPNLNQNVSPEPRLIIPKLNVDVPVAFGIKNSEVNAYMNQGVAQFSVPGANALPGQIGNLVISGHSAGDIYSSNPYKFIFSGLERLENGDLIYINYNSTRYTYQMTKREVVEPTNVAALVYPTDKPMLTLITCTPLGTSRYRLLITAEQISPEYDLANVQDSEITPEPGVETDTGEAMPANEPSFFRKIWNWLTGQN